MLYNDNKRYYTLNNYLQTKFGCKVFKVSLNAGFTCPNIDGKVGYGGCIYCKNGSKSYGSDINDLVAQFNEVKDKVSKKWPNSKYIAYFQANTNTYASVDVLREKYEAVLSLPDVVGISIATRSDSISEDVLPYLEELNKRTFLIVELGLQSSNEKTGMLINRCHDLKCFDDMVIKLKKRGINVVVHIINGLPYETRDDMLETVRHLNGLNIDGIKIHMLNIVRGTKIAKMYEEEKFKTLSKEEYVNITCDQLEILNSNVVVHRLTSDPDKDELIEPMWLVKKFGVLNDIDKCLKKRHTYQGFNSNILNKFRQILDLGVKQNDIVVDATVGNGNDTLYLANLVKNGFVFGFDVQGCAIDRTLKLLKENDVSNYRLYNTSHENIDKVLCDYKGKISSIVYNLGYLPNGDKSITTRCDSTIKSICNGIKLINNKGFILIVVYPHAEGIKEGMALRNLKIDGYKVIEYHNTDKVDSPYMVEIKKA